MVVFDLVMMATAVLFLHELKHVEFHAEHATGTPRPEKLAEDSNSREATVEASPNIDPSSQKFRHLPRTFLRVIKIPCNSSHADVGRSPVGDLVPNTDYTIDTILYFPFHEVSELTRCLGIKPSNQHEDVIHFWALKPIKFLAHKINHLMICSLPCIFQQHFPTTSLQISRGPNGHQLSQPRHSLVGPTPAAYLTLRRYDRIFQSLPIFKTHSTDPYSVRANSIRLITRSLSVVPLV